MTDAQLARAIADAALLRGEFTLRSGRTSRYYLDKYRFETRPELLAPIAERLEAKLNGAEKIAGPELGGVALATAVSLRAGLPMVLIRNAKKGYGTSNRFEGVLEKGEKIAITEDIATSGGQALEAAKLLRDDLGCEVTNVIVVIDRQEGAREAIEDAGFRFDSVFTKADLGIDE